MSKRIKKGISSMVGMQPSATLAPTTVNLPDQAISVAGQLNQFNALQPTQCYEMSVSCRKAVSCIVNEASRAKLRIFTRDGDEVTDGPLVQLLKNPLKNWSTKRFVADIMSWHLIEGEIAVALGDFEGGKPRTMLPLAPNRLYPIDPTTPNEIQDIKEWFYTWNDGYTDQLMNADVFRPRPKTVNQGWLSRSDSTRYMADCVIFAPNFNPYSHVRGLSPFVTGVNAASVNYQAMRYMKDFYTNNAVPSHIIELRGNKSQKQLQDWKEKYLEQYSTRNANSQKVMVSNGGELQVHKLDNDHKTKEEIDLLNYTDEQVMVLFSIPPIVFGHFKQTRFETAAQERSQFLEATILPVCNVVADVLQFQLVDRFFSLSPIHRGENIKSMKKSLRGLVEKRFDEKPDSEYVVVMDPDPIPLMTQVRIDQANAVDAVCLKMRMSVNEACDWLHIEIPQSPLRDKVLVSNTLAELTEETFPPQPPREAERDTHTVALDRGETEKHSAESPKKTQGEAAKDAKQAQAKPAANSRNVSAKAKSLMKAYREMRMIAMKSIDESNALFSIRDVDAQFKSVYEEIPVFRREIRKDYAKLRAIIKDKAPSERVVAVREFYREKRPAVLRELINE